MGGYILRYVEHIGQQEDQYDNHDNGATRAMPTNTLASVLRPTD